MSLLFFKKVIKVKCYVICYRCHSILLSQVSYIAFIVLYAYVITMYFPKFDSNATLGGLSVVEIILYFWIFTIILEEIRQVGVSHCIVFLLCWCLHYIIFTPILTNTVFTRISARRFSCLKGGAYSRAAFSWGWRLFESWTRQRIVLSTVILLLLLLFVLN